MKPYYVTTPIYYVNDKPHIGHAYSTIGVDVLARFHRLRGCPTRFLTGLDEHGLKIERAAKAKGTDPQAFVDSMVPAFKDAWELLRCTNDDFIRTTDARHKDRVQRLWTMLEEKGDIYLGEYEDWYCVGCESFKTEKELLEGNLCPDHKKPVEKIKETSYFFRLSRFTEPLLEYYEQHPDFVHPAGRFNEVKSFVREGLRDLSISRTSFEWGIPVPGNSEHVIYVWLDALTNYISSLGGPAPSGEAPLFDEFWNGDGRMVHIVGKDILRFHAIFWPAFLLSAGVEVPSQIWAHGWLTVNGEKMSKSLGNFLPPGPLVEAFGADVLRYYLMREIAFGNDGDFSHKNLIARYNGELANGLGNLLNRIVPSFVKNKLDGKVPDVSAETLQDVDRALIATAERVSREAIAHLENVAPNRALDSLWELVAAGNKYVDETAPWALARENDLVRLGEVSYMVMETLRWLSVLIWPFMPDKCDALRAQLGLAPLDPQVGEDAMPTEWFGLPAGIETAPGLPLFPRIEPKEEAQILEDLGVDAKKEAAPPKREKKQKASPKKAPAARADAEGPASEDGLIAFDDFMKVDLRVGLVKEAEKVAKSKKLLRLMVDVGEEAPRQILAGISEHYAPEQLVGRQVLVVVNLAPRKMMGLESHGMVVAASDEAGLSVLSPDKELAPGSRAS